MQNIKPHTTPICEPAYPIPIAEAENDDQSFGSGEGKWWFFFFLSPALQLRWSFDHRGRRTKRRRLVSYDSFPVDVRPAVVKAKYI